MSVTDIIKAFPVQIYDGFVPSDVDGDGMDLNASHKQCPGYSGDYRPRWTHTFKAPRGNLPHHAEDIMAAEGALIVAPFDGVIPTTLRIKMDGAMGNQPGAGTKTKAGNYVFIHSADGRLRVYISHMRDVPLVRPGERVSAGQVLGYCGRTGNAVRTYKAPGGKIRRGCPHAHIAFTALTSDFFHEVRRAGITVGSGRKLDPVPFLKPVYDAGGWQYTGTWTRDCAPRLK